MNWNRDKSVKLSIVCVFLFGAVLLVLDAGAYWITGWYVRLRSMPRQYGGLLMISIYSGSVFAWICLYRLWRLLKNISRGEVFCRENMDNMRSVSWCCACAAAICLVSGIYYLPFVIIAASAGFMALIVRVVKNAFQQAIEMKDELDFTV